MVVLKLVREVDTRWRLYELREPLGRALVSLATDIRTPSAEEYETPGQTCSLAAIQPS